jgi:tRNA(fMet)-specific endonuclease VapC
VILLDTNVLIHYLKCRPAVVGRVKAAAGRELAISSIMRYELECGVLQLGNHPAKRRIVRDLCDGLQQIPFDEAAALEAAQIRTDLSARGQVIGPLDLLIAGTARSRGAMLVTNNMREFSRVKGLRCEDWSSEEE